jgi:hypothetical protein
MISISCSTPFFVHINDQEAFSGAKAFCSTLEETSINLGELILGHVNEQGTWSLAQPDKHSWREVEGAQRNLL